MAEFLFHWNFSSSKPNFHKCCFVFQGFMSVLKAMFFQLLSWDQVTHFFTVMLAASLVLATSCHLNKGQLPFPAAIQNSNIWSAFEVPPHIVSFLPVILTYEIPLTALGTIAQSAAFIPKKPGKISLICLCSWILLHVQSWLWKWKELEKYITLLDFGILRVSFWIMFVVIPNVCCSVDRSLVFLLTSDFPLCLVLDIFLTN